MLRQLLGAALRCEESRRLSSDGREEKGRFAVRGRETCWRLESDWERGTEDRYLWTVDSKDRLGNLSRLTSDQSITSFFREEWLGRVAVGKDGWDGMDWEERIEGNWERDAPWDSSEGTGTAEGCICLEMSVSSEDDSTVGFFGDARGSDSLGEDCFSFAVEKGIQLNGMEELDCASP